MNLNPASMTAAYNMAMFLNVHQLCGKKIMLDTITCRELQKNHDPLNCFPNFYPLKTKWSPTTQDLIVLPARTFNNSYFEQCKDGFV